MKKVFILLSAIAFAAALYAQEQDKLVLSASTSKKITKELTPKQIIDSLNRMFPNAKAVQYYQTPASGVKNGWLISEEGDLASSDVDYYTISFKSDQFRYYALFKYDGTLVMSKYEQTDVPLPEAVKTSILALGADKYKDYKLLSKTYYKSVKHDKNQEFYEIKAVNKTNKNDVKTVIVAPDGTVLKEK